MDDFPGSALRGILNKNFIDNGRPKHNVFKEGFCSNGEHYELSINWYDCEEALDQIKNQINDKKNEPRYRFAVPLIREDIDRISCTTGLQGKMSYERAKLDDNEYHGNIIMGNGCVENDLKNLSFSLIFCCGEIIPFDDETTKKIEKL